jgi:hypothetical protein
VAPVLQALAKLKEVKVFDDEAAWAAAAQAAPVAMVGEARLCLFMEWTWPPKRPAVQGSRAAGRRNRQGQRQAGQRGLRRQSQAGRDRAGAETPG